MKRLTYRLGLLGLGLTLAVALLSLFWTPWPLDGMTGGRLAGPSAAHWAGTDRLGRDSLSQVMVGARIALTVGVGAACLGGLIGTFVGVVAAFAQDWLEDTLAAAFDILIAFPTLLLAMLIVAASDEASLSSAILAIGIAMSAIIARLVRVLARRVLALDFITAARCCGASWPRIVLTHLLPNIAPTLLVALALQAGLAVIAEASLSYLGLGAPPPNASWGQLLYQAQATVYTAPLGVLVPGAALVALVLAINFVADGLRDRLDAEAEAPR